MPTSSTRPDDPARRQGPLRGPARRLRIAMVCLHTSPLRQPGQGDAGGMNVYVRQLATELVRLLHAVDLITLWRDSEHPGEPRPADAVSVEPVLAPDGGELPGLRLITVTLPQTASAAKDDLPEHLPAIADALRAADPELLPRPDVLHGHYWLSGELARSLAAVWGCPFALTLHTSARGKNSLAATGESPEPAAREDAEQRLIHDAAAVVVNTAAEAQQLRDLYDAEPDQLRIIPPGVDLEIFRPAEHDDSRTLPVEGPADAPPRAEHPSGSAAHGPGKRELSAEPVIGFAGRLQALKGPQILLEALGMLAQDPQQPLRPRLLLAGVGDESFTASLHEQAQGLGLTAQIDWLGSLPVDGLAAIMRRADVWAVPSSSETFGLVALEAQACGTPVLASDAGGLSAAVDDGRTGWLVAHRTPEAWAQALRVALSDPAELSGRGRAAAERARGFSWAEAARAHVLTVYGPLEWRP